MSMGCTAHVTALSYVLALQKHLMMLPTDMVSPDWISLSTRAGSVETDTTAAADLQALIWDNKYKPWVQKYAKDEVCWPSA